MGDEEIREAATAVQQSVGVSAYLYGVGYNLEKFEEELGATIRHIKSHAKVKVAK